MGLIIYDNLEDGTKITANIFNERFGAIVKEINGKLDQLNFKAEGIPASALAPNVFERIYPIGSIYFNSVNNTNPGELLGFGTWTRFGEGRVLAGFDPEDTDFNGAEKTGGEKTHTLTEAEMPAHNHAASTNSAGAHAHTADAGWTTQAHNHSGFGKFAESPSPRNSVSKQTTDSAGGHTHTVTVSNKGGGGAHNNLQPYITVYAWKRTA